jgi:small subunit ribosomal protein S20
MANTKSAAKRARQSVNRTERNRKVKVSVKAELKAIRAAIAGGKKDEAKALLPKVTKVLDRAAKTRRVHKNKANRHKSDLAAQIAAIK